MPDDVAGQSGPREKRSNTPLGDVSLFNLVDLYGHLSDKGDVFAAEGYINFPDDHFSFQSIGVVCTIDAVEYRVRSADGSWTDWAERGRVLGTKGVRLDLKGFAMRLKPDFQGVLSLKMIARFSDGSVQTSYADATLYGEDEATLRGLHVTLTRRA